MLTLFFEHLHNIFSNKLWHMFFFLSGDSGEVEYESKLVPCCAMLVIGSLGLIWTMSAFAKFPGTYARWPVICRESQVRKSIAHELFLWEPGTGSYPTHAQWSHKCLEPRRQSSKKRLLRHQAINLAAPESIKAREHDTLKLKERWYQREWHEYWYPCQKALTDYYRNQDTPDLVCLSGNTAGRSVSQLSGPGCNLIQNLYARWSCSSLILYIRSSSAMWIYDCHWYSTQHVRQVAHLRLATLEASS